ncbi:helix-turn-helix transcriptional regulator [Thermoactinomyces daqus]|uniref:Helix-turn-helix transcriptional regulator n=1 Tax=Thermoactinomyces daqus TaxID=1329516 RepID=A0A7W1X8H0_9BACL|nr:helix-turn-helix transcriptional regulator [Thermoactinomyces daqus]MBA4541954.1 helix-turn-helix transcriptional regulator [Thermoactinomyces daqus]
MQNRIREIRKAKGLTQHQLAFLFHEPLHPTVISRWERGVSSPSSENLFELARILEVKPDELFIETDSQS